MTRKTYDQLTETNHTNDGWVNLTGCNACINDEVCKFNQSCILLTVNQLCPDYIKRKRRLICQIRTHGIGTKEYIDFVKKQALKQQKRYELKKVDAKPKLTKFEQLCIDNLNKKR